MTCMTSTYSPCDGDGYVLSQRAVNANVLECSVNGPCLLDYLILNLRLPVVLYVSFAVVSR